MPASHTGRNRAERDHLHMEGGEGRKRGQREEERGDSCQSGRRGTPREPREGERGPHACRSGRWGRGREKWKEKNEREHGGRYWEYRAAGTGLSGTILGSSLGLMSESLLTMVREGIPEQDDTGTDTQECGGGSPPEDKWGKSVLGRGVVRAETQHESKSGKTVRLWTGSRDQDWIVKGLLGHGKDVSNFFKDLFISKAE